MRSLKESRLNLQYHSLPPPPASDFALWPCRLSNEATQSFARTYSIDPSVYRVFVVPFAGKMSTKYIPLPIAHFEVGFRLPLDLAFVDFLVYARVQPGQIHPNAVHTIMTLICLCRRLGCEFSSNILRMFFSSLIMTDNNQSLRSRKNKVQLFDSPPNRVEFRGR